MLEGPLTRRCSVETFRECANDDGCNTCDGCTILGQTCRPVARLCFIGSGQIGDTVGVDGHADVPCAGTAFPTVGSFFCIAPVKEPSVNGAAGRPALGRIRVPGTVTVAP